MRRPLLPALVLAAALMPAALRAQSFEITPDVPKALVGDEVKLTVKVSLLPGQELLDLVPKNLIPPPAGTRVIAVDTLRATGPLEYTGKITIAWFRVGPQPVPTFDLLYRPEPNALPDTLVHAPVPMEIASLLPAGNPSLKDIRPLLWISGPVWLQMLFLASLVGGGFGWLWWRSRPKDRGRAAATVAVELDPGPFVRALRALDALDTRAEATGVDPLYGEVAAVLRGCLLEIGALPYPGLTTPEAPHRLPEPLKAGGGAEQLLRVLGDSDLVKFAAVHPDLPAARHHVDGARRLLEGWRAIAERKPPAEEAA